MAIIPHPAHSVFKGLSENSSPSHYSLMSYAPIHFSNLKSFDSWGASMYLHEPYRSMLQALGVLNDTPNNFKSKKTLETAADTLFEIRCSMYRGDYDSTDKLIKSVNQNLLSKKETSWLNYLKKTKQVLCKEAQFDDWDITSGEDNQLHFLGLSAHMNFLISTRASQKAKEATRDRLDEITSSLRTGAVSQRVLRIRLLRLDLLSESITLENAHASFHTEFSDIIEKKQIDIFPPSSDLYLLQESCRRFLDSATLLAFQKGLWKIARVFAHLAVRVDPLCPYAMMLYSEACMRVGVSPRVLRNLFGYSTIFGVLEAPYSFARYTSLRNKNKQIDEALLHVIDSDFFHSSGLLENSVSQLQNFPSQTETTQTWIEARRTTAVPTKFEPPITVSFVDQLISGLDRSNKSKKLSITESEVYSRLSVYWTLQEKHNAQLPFFAKNCSVSYDIWKNNREPWFETLYFQPGLRPGFRSELIYCALGNPWQSSVQQAFGGTLRSLKGASIKARSLSTYFAEKEFTSALDKAHFARTLSYLGFNDEAVETIGPLSQFSSHTQLDAASTYLGYTLLHILDLSGDYSKVPELANILFENAASDENSLRTRWNICQLVGVLVAKQGNLHECEKWRHRGAYELEKIQASRSFSAFEKQLLTSRFFRFASFVPFLRKDSAALILETDKFTDLAFNLETNTDREQLLRQENLYAVLESRARVLEFLGKRNEAMEIVLRATEIADPFDSHLRLNLADLKEKLGDLKGALEACHAAIKLGPPFRALALFKAGLLYEKLGDNENAIGAHFRSIYSNPEGFSPLIKIYELSAAKRYYLIRRWASECLTTFHQSGVLSSSQLEKLEFFNLRSAA